jgi:hypothetical protein
VSDTCTAAEALGRFRHENGLRHDEHALPFWRIGIGAVQFLLPNFAWRRRAIAAHDLHHLLTGYPCTVAGEVQIAAWEFGAGRYPHWGATLFCLPLVIAGLLWMPGDVLAAFRRGRSQRSLYDGAILESLADLPLSAARAWVVSGTRPETLQAISSQESLFAAPSR